MVCSAINRRRQGSCATFFCDQRWSQASRVFVPDEGFVMPKLHKHIYYPVGSSSPVESSTPIQEHDWLCPRCNNINAECHKECESKLRCSPWTPQCLAFVSGEGFVDRTHSLRFGVYPSFPSPPYTSPPLSTLPKSRPCATEGCAFLSDDSFCCLACRRWGPTEHGVRRSRLRFPTLDISGLQTAPRPILNSPLYVDVCPTTAQWLPPFSDTSPPAPGRPSHHRDAMVTFPSTRWSPDLFRMPSRTPSIARRTSLVHSVATQTPAYPVNAYTSSYLRDHPVQGQVLWSDEYGVIPTESPATLGIMPPFSREV